MIFPHPIRFVVCGLTVTVVGVIKLFVDSLYNDSLVSNSVSAESDVAAGFLAMKYPP